MMPAENLSLILFTLGAWALFVIGFVTLTALCLRAWLASLAAPAPREDEAES